MQWRRSRTAELLRSIDPSARFVAATGASAPWSLAYAAWLAFEDGALPVGPETAVEDERVTMPALTRCEPQPVRDRT